MSSTPNFDPTPITLEGHLVRLEPLTRAHISELAEIAFEPSIWQWTNVRLTDPASLEAYVAAALEEQASGRSLPWVTRSKSTGRLAGSTRFADIVPQHRTLEIGGTWLNPAFHRTGLNVEAKYLQLCHAFETLGALRVSLKTHHQNLRSQQAIAGLGAMQEGVFRNHMIHTDGTPRHSVWFSIVQQDWPRVKAHLQARLQDFPAS